jgi:hypothetical protein
LLRKNSIQWNIFKEVVNLKIFRAKHLPLKIFLKKSLGCCKRVEPPTHLWVDWGGGWKNQINEKLTFVNKWLTEAVDKSNDY